MIRYFRIAVFVYASLIVLGGYIAVSSVITMGADAERVARLHFLQADANEVASHTVLEFDSITPAAGDSE